MLNIIYEFQIIIQIIFKNKTKKKESNRHYRTFQKLNLSMQILFMFKF